MTADTLFSDQFTIELEQQEAAYWGEYYKNVPPEIVRKLGINFLNIEEASIGTAAHIDVLAFNRVMGLGLEQPVKEKQLQEIIDFYKGGGARRFFIQVSPYTKPDHLPEILRSYFKVRDLNTTTNG